MGVYHFSGEGGPNFSRGCGVQMLISIETYRICDFPGGPGPPYPSGSAHVYDRSTCDIQIFKSTVKPIPKDRFFFHAIVHFPFPEHLVTPQNMMRYMILQYVSGKQMLRPRTLVRVETQWLSRLLVNYSWFQSFIMYIRLGLDFWHQF